MVFLIFFSIFEQNLIIVNKMFRDFTKYEVYPNGKIWSYSHKKWLKPIIDNNGYQRVFLSDNEGKRKWYFVHRVVWEAVTGSPIPENLEINHRSEVKTENSITNLELLSHKQNINYGTRNLRSAKSHTNNHKRSKAVGAYKDGKLVMTFKSTKEAQRQGFNSGHISACCRSCYLREGNNVYKGFEWRYI